MHKGYVYDDQPFEYRDKFSACKVTRLTHYLGHSSTLYFLTPVG